MKLYLPEPAFNSTLTHLIFELEHLRNQARNQIIQGSTPMWLFFDLKEIMQFLESLTSARIEGNRTTILGVIEAIIRKNQKTKDEQLLEIMNIQRAIEFIEKNCSGNPIDKSFICELHKIVVDGLKREGSQSPGRYRKVPVSIGQSKHVPPHAADVPDLMEELIDFAGSPNLPQQDLLKTAIIHHRMAWIHPFDNGNGRVTRLVTYAMLTKQKFIDDKGLRILNPTAIFCMDRSKYYDMLEWADRGDDSSLLAWSEYVLGGIKSEINKINLLLSADYTKDNIIRPALNEALSKEWLAPVEHKILTIAMAKDVLKASDVKHLVGGDGAYASTQISRIIANMKRRGYLMSLPNHPRMYVLRFSNNYLLRSVMEQLDAHELLPLKPNE